eukprot:UN30723
MVNVDELTRSDLEPMIGNFETKIEQLREKASQLLEKAKTQETNSDKLPEIVKYFEQIKEKFQRGHYKEDILGELERNYAQIKTMHLKLQREEREDQTLNDILTNLEKSADTQVFDYMRSVIDERNALVDQYEKNLKN